jgi:hypothetical protein
MMQQEDTVGAKEIPQEQGCRLQFSAGVLILFLLGLSRLGGQAWRKRYFCKVDALTTVSVLIISTLDRDKIIPRESTTQAPVRA